ncbi:MAG: amidohydrolase [Alphaproteobacteria bacterium]|nr:amidohydrolase [Alphaproteobacteria bacterium]
MPTSLMISADSHVQEPPEVYGERLPQRLRHRAPRIETRDGKRYLIVDGKKPRRLDVAEALADEDDQNREFRKDPTGGRDLTLRLKDQERDGVLAEVIYPNTSLFLYNSRDPEYQLAVARAYNDWASELFGAQPKRFAPVGIVPVEDVGAAVVEVERAAKLGFRSIKIPITHTRRPYNRPEYEPLWAACAANDVVLALHAFSNAEDTYPEDWGEEEGIGGALAHMAMSMADGQNPVALLISSGALQRHPKLKVVIVECGAGWLAWLLYVLDEQVRKKHMWVKPRLDALPSEYFNRQGFVTFSDDPVALNNLKYTGAQSMLWGSDYPHDEGTFPHSQAVVARIFQGVSEADKRAIVHDNAARLYGLG